jgi:hypothetical protein
MRLPARFLLTGAAALVVISCYSDNAVAPASPPVISGNAVLRALVVETSVDFVIPAAGGTINVLGAYTLTFPANAVCDPNAADTQAGYASGEWDSECTVASGDIAVRATLRHVNGVLYSDFQPALRFAPNANVTISTDLLAPVVRYYDEAGLATGWSISHTTAIGAPLEYDAFLDSSVRTVVIGSTGRVFRRIKHFSGYSVATGEGYIPCDPAEGNPLCIWYDDEENPPLDGR